MFEVHPFAQITNVNVKKRQVTGVLTVEVKDKNHGWVMDYEFSKPYFQEWSSEIHNASGGKSYGNLRMMHQLENVGKIPYELEYDDPNNRILCTAEVTDDKAWEKVMNGELIGFSWSGVKVPPPQAAIAKWSKLPDGPSRYVGKPMELSLVDNPNQPGAYFSVVNAAGKPVFKVEKEDGTTEEHEFVINTSLYEITSLADQLANIRWTNTGDADLQEDFNKAITKLMGIMVKMMQNIKKEHKESPMITAENSAEGEINKMEETKETPVVPPTTPEPIFNAAQTELITNTVASVVKDMLVELNIGDLVKNAVEAVVSPIRAELDAIKEITPVQNTTVVTKETDSATTPNPVTTTPAIVANAAEGVTEADAALLTKIRNIHTAGQKK